MIAIVELGGGWIPSDMEAFFKSISQPVPQITDVSVDGTQNSKQNPKNDADGEVALDIQVAGAAYYAATGTPAVIRVYWANDDIAGAVRKATADGCDVCSISWGSDEANWGTAAVEDMEAAATAATQSGMVVFGASGDNDSSDGGPNAANVDAPSSCPHVIGCGGTNKTATTETVWNDDPGETSGEGTGGGFSTTQYSPCKRGRQERRMGPDGWFPIWLRTRIHGPDTTSFCMARAPWWVGRARLLRFMPAYLLPLGRSLGSSLRNYGQTNSASSATSRKETMEPLVRVPGPDPCTGLGSPIGRKLAKLFAAGAPSSAARRLGSSHAARTGGAAV